MQIFWDAILHPILKIVAPRKILEIGAETGATTSLLIEFCRETGAHLTSIEPTAEEATRGEIYDALRRKGGDAFEVVADLSLNALPTLPPMDVVLIDGDHNWYTVYHELLSLEAKAARGGFPLVFLDDVCWPWGRRDQCYAPDKIPAAHRQPYRRGGLWPGVQGQLEQGGVLHTFDTAVQEGGPRNGVRTALDDFMHGSKRSFRYVNVPTDAGLGILAPVDLLDAKPALSAKLDELAFSPAIDELLTDSMAAYKATFLGYQMLSAIVSRPRAAS